VLKFDEGPLISGLFVFSGTLSGAPHGNAAISLSGSRCFARPSSSPCAFTPLKRRSSASPSRPLPEFGGDDAFEIICDASCCVRSSREGVRPLVVEASDRATPNTAPDKILHYGGATRADPNENEHTPLVWKPAHPLLRFAIMASVRSKRILRCSAGPQKRLKPNQRKEISSQFVLF
jgi:hypothetical protein